MFFIMGITDGRKDFDFTQTIICNLCGKYGRYQVFMTYTVLSLFFIPCFKWNKHYYVQTSCCNTLYELAPEIGKAIARGEQVEIQPEHLTKVSRALCINIVHSVGTRQPRISSFVRSVERGFRGVVRV